MHKRGLSHIEFIISFVIFMGFLIFGFYFFNPLDSNRVLDSSLFYTRDAISRNASSTLVSYSLVISNPPSENVAVSLSKGRASGKGVRIEASSGQKLMCALDGENSVFSLSSNRFVVVSFGDFLPCEDEIAEPVFLKYPEDYSISSSDEKIILSEYRLRLVNESYWTDYDNLKKQFNLPGRIDFLFSVAFSDSDKIIAERAIPEDIEVLSDIKRTEVIRMDGSRAYADIAVAVW